MACPRCAVDWAHLHVTDVLRRAGLLSIEWSTPEALQRGQFIHQAIALGDNLDTDDMDPAWAGYVQAWLAWKRESGAVMLAQEQPVQCRSLGYTGTLDGIFRLGDKTYIADWKSGHAPASAQVQTAAYALAYNATASEPVRHRAVLQLSKDGSYRWIPCTSKDDEAVFRAALLCAQWQVRNGVSHD
jgi:hypothetical protein